jgi:probable rRNA maturation factor
VPRAGIRTALALLDRFADKFLGGCPPGELSLAFMTDPAIARIHAEFMDEPTPTDVITFGGDCAGPDSSRPGNAGEICVSVDAAARHVARARTRPRRQSPRPPTDLATELTLYLIHGWLHLAGYDDRKPIDRRRMRAAEKRALGLLRRAGAIPAFRLT